MSFIRAQKKMSKYLPIPMLVVTCCIQCETRASHTSSFNCLSCVPVHCFVIHCASVVHLLSGTKPIHPGTAISMIGQGGTHK